LERLVAIDVIVYLFIYILIKFFNSFTVVEFQPIQRALGYSLWEENLWGRKQYGRNLRILLL